MSHSLRYHPDRQSSQMSVREHLAASALQGLLAGRPPGLPLTREDMIDLVADSVTAADLLLDILADTDDAVMPDGPPPF